ncbi:MAG: FAD-binding protein, partial [Alphaproteobacteria bacterium]|nr:FAD-binding protein [Alphaproteobacteria bacterium]
MTTETWSNAGHGRTGRGHRHMTEPTAQGFHDSYDIVIVGYGYAGGIAAIEAHDAGARVLLIDKMANPGGISVCSYGAMRSAHDAGQAFAYLKATNGGRTPDDVLRALADGMAGMEDYVRTLV